MRQSIVDRIEEIQTVFSLHDIWRVKVPVRSNFPKFMFMDFSKVYAAVTYHAKPFFNPSTRSPFFFHGISRILCPPLIGHVPTAQYEAWA